MEPFAQHCGAESNALPLKPSLFNLEQRMRRKRPNCIAPIHILCTGAKPVAQILPVKVRRRRI